jgi:hypothetical protein
LIEKHDNKAVPNRPEGETGKFGDESHLPKRRGLLNRAFQRG